MSAYCLSELRTHAYLGKSHCRTSKAQASQRTALDENKNIAPYSYQNIVVGT